METESKAFESTVELNHVLHLTNIVYICSSAGMMGNEQWILGLVWETDSFLQSVQEF